MFTTPPPPQRVPSPYQPEAAVVSSLLVPLQTALDWAAAAKIAELWIHAVRNNPPPFWAMESLALMRLAGALLRVPDVETAIALTVDQLGRADFKASGDKTMARLASNAIGFIQKVSA